MRLVAAAALRCGAEHLLLDRQMQLRYRASDITSFTYRKPIIASTPAHRRALSQTVHAPRGERLIVLSAPITGKTTALTQDLTAYFRGAPGLMAACLPAAQAYLQQRLFILPIAGTSARRRSRPRPPWRTWLLRCQSFSPLPSCGSAPASRWAGAMNAEPCSQIPSSPADYDVL